MNATTGTTSNTKGFTFTLSDNPLAKINPRNLNDIAKPSWKTTVAPNIVAQDSAPLGQSEVVDNHNGFIHAACMAYNHHHHLILRPDDVWLAIIIQFSAYVTANADKLRSKLVAHDDKKELEVRSMDTMNTANYPALCLAMVQEIRKNIKDPEVANWAIPKFSTTTNQDVMSGCVALMSTLKKFFAYKFTFMCGIPQVTLLGTVEDWKDIETRAAKLVNHDVDGIMKQWYAMLQPILLNLTLSRSGNPNVDWWNRICSTLGNGSGARYLSGWIAVFCVFDDAGKWCGDDRKVSQWDSEVLECTDEVFAPEGWPLINNVNIPAGSCQVDIIIDDRGTIYDCQLEAGHMQICKMSDIAVSPGVKWMLTIKPEK